MRDEILAWEDDQWVEVGKMKVPKSFHAVTNIMMDEEVMQFCD